MDNVLFEEISANNGKRIGRATLSVEKTLNSLTLDMCEALLEKFQQWAADSEVVAVWLDGAGEKAFCAGGDVQQLHKSATDNPGGPCTYAEAFFETEYRLDYLIHTFPKPIVCWGHGIVMGGGLGLFAGASHCVVTERTRIAMPEITIALYPDVGGTWFLNRMPGKSGLFIALTAASINAADALYGGIAKHFASSEKRDDILKRLEQLSWTGEARSDGELIDGLFDEPCSVEGNLEPHQTLMDELCAGDDLNTIVERILSLETDDVWVQKAQAALKHGSPIAAHSIWQQAQKGGLSLKDVFQFEMMLSTNVVRHPEFAEGVRALLIDKDKNPDWQYKSVDSVPQALMTSFMTPPWDTNPLHNLGE